MQRQSLSYGTDSLSFKLPNHSVCLSVRDSEPLITPTLFGRRLSTVLGERDLSSDRIAVVVADKTRLCGYPEYLPVLLEALTACGAEPGRITFYIAYGTHPHQSDRVCLEAYGEVYRRCRFVHHDCTDPALFEHLGTTFRGTPVRLRRDLLAADFRVTFGAVSHHYFAGFGGGRKLIFPGLGSQVGIYHNHSLFLDHRTGGLHPGCQPGRLAGNPLAEDLAEVESFCPVHLAIHGLLDSHGRVCDLLVGRGREHFENACRIHAGTCEIHTASRFETVLASCGGHPKDINFIQAHKALHNAAAFVQDGGRLILLARCPDGIGSTTFLPWFDKESYPVAFAELAANYSGNGGTALSMMEKAHRIQVALVTDLDAATARRIGVELISYEEAACRVLETAGTMAVIANASLTVRQAT